MKHLLFVLFIIVGFSSSATSFDKRVIAPPVCLSISLVETEFLESARISPQWQWLAFEVIGYLLSELLPAVFTEICTDLGGNPEMCNAGGQAISLLLNLEEGNLRIGKTGSIEWKVSKGAKESYVSFKTRDAYISNKLKQLLLSYSENCAKGLFWKKIINLDYNDVNINLAYNTPVRHIKIQNNAGYPLPFSASVDGSKWATSSKGMDMHTGPGLLGDLYPYYPIEINFRSEASWPFYFNDGIYIKYFDGVSNQIVFLRYDSKYAFNYLNGRLVASVCHQKE